jgi:hypothetical protein
MGGWVNPYGSVAALTRASAGIVYGLYTCLLSRRIQKALSITVVPAGIDNNSVANE